MKYEIKIQFDRDDLDTLHDVIFNSLKKDLIDEQVIEYWNKLPEDITLDAVKWGVDDTPTRDNMYRWFKENCIHKDDVEKL